MKMTKEMYRELERYMQESMTDSAHDKEHIYRVLYAALDIAKDEVNVNYEVLITACLLHDIGRNKQFENPGLCHAAVGSEMAYQYLTEHGWETAFAGQVKRCIASHRFRSDNQPDSVEGKILFDADKLDVTGALGIARTLLYKGQVSEPIYTVTKEGTIFDGSNDTMPSFLQEYKFKLEGLYSKFYTRRGKELAEARRPAAAAYYNSILDETRLVYNCGIEELKTVLTNSPAAAKHN